MVFKTTNLHRNPQKIKSYETYFLKLRLTWRTKKFSFLYPKRKT